ncbi:MAG: lysophospholipid acyltransferase family protein [Pseudomonadota bacterium]
MHVILGTLYGVAYWLTFLVCALACVLLVTILPVLTWRQAAARACASAVFLLTGTRARRFGFEQLPEGPSVVVANHASYIDGVLLFSILPTGFSFVIKAEMQQVPLAGFVLKRLGSFFVQREHVQSSARSARQVMRAAIQGRPIGFFPEGTFDENPGLKRFYKGAFATARMAALPVVPVVIRGTRRLLPADRWLPYPSRLQVEVLTPIPAGIVSDQTAIESMTTARDAIAAKLDEPDLLLADHTGPAD